MNMYSMSLRQGLKSIIQTRNYAAGATIKYGKTATASKPRTAYTSSRISSVRSSTTTPKVVSEATPEATQSSSIGEENSVAKVEKEVKVQPSSTSSKTLTFNDTPVFNMPVQNPNEPINWSDSFFGLGSSSFSREISDILLAPLANEDIEITPDGLLYLPEIKYRRILNRAFGPGGWGLAPRTETLITPTQISREYGLICHGRLIGVARGEQDYFGGDSKVTTALEGCKSNALMRCCKDLGIASELWDPHFIRVWKKKFCDEEFTEHVVTKRKKKMWKLKTRTFEYPYKKA
ncbi:mitochondrial genome maintenance protein MGM101 [Scheffersomyces amazonensis]|uniref:mitochondrial genome maintenance protein MGM101 n=1 Tax=Scheffersomyces amazonensis TaxID=1078765 RepID=UPI00315DC68A